MKIHWKENPLETIVELDGSDRERLLLAIMNGEYANLLCDLDLWLDSKIRKDEKPEIEAIHAQVKKWNEICDMGYDNEYFQMYENDLKHNHIGDCTCMAATCIKCLAEEMLGINTIEGLGKHPGAKIFAVFKDEDTTIDEALEGLTRPMQRNTKVWKDEEAWKKHLPRWESERKHAYNWLKAYKERHGFGT